MMRAILRALKKNRGLVLAAAALAAYMGHSYFDAKKSYDLFYQRTPLMRDLQLETKKRPVANRDTSAVFLKQFPIGTDKQTAIEGLLRSGFRLLWLSPCKGRDYDACETLTLDASHYQFLVETSHRVTLVFAHGKLMAITGDIGLTGL